MSLADRLKSPNARIRTEAKRQQELHRQLREEMKFAAAEANDSAPPIRPMSVSGRADLGSSGGSESCVLGRAGIGKHGQPRQPGAHGPDAGGNPAKLGAPIKRVEGPHLWWNSGPLA